MSRRITRRDFLQAFAAMGLALPGPLSLFEVKRPRGLDFNHVNSPTPQKYLVETMGGGVALFDYNNDGLLDIFLVNSGRLANPMHSPETFDRQDPAKTTKISERFDLEIRADASDLLNHPNFFNPVLTAGSATLGVITAGTRAPAGDFGSSRQIQLSMKLIF